VANKKFPLGMLIIVLGTLGLTVTGCGTIRSVGVMSHAAIEDFHLEDLNNRGFYNLQYYVSRDIVLIKDQRLTNVIPRNAQYDPGTGLIVRDRDTIQLVSTTPGAIRPDTYYPYNVYIKAIERIPHYEPYGVYRLGVAFEKNGTDLLWFVQKPHKGPYFYLDYTNEAERKVKYGQEFDGQDAIYTVYYEKAKGPAAFFQRIRSDSKVKKLAKEYEYFEPILLFKAVEYGRKRSRTLPGYKF